MVCLKERAVKGRFAEVLIGYQRLSKSLGYVIKTFRRSDSFSECRQHPIYYGQLGFCFGF